MKNIKTNILTILLILLVFLQTGLILLLVKQEADDQAVMQAAYFENEKVLDVVEFVDDIEDEIEEEVLGDLPRHYAYFSSQEFYDEAFAQAQGQEFVAGSKVYGGVVPHHLMVKDKIAAFFKSIEQFDYETVILIGPNHFEQGDSNIILSRAEWETPYGVLSPDLGLIDELVGSRLNPLIPTRSDRKFAITTGGGWDVFEQPFNIEHSISGLVAFIKKTFPNSKFVPVILKSQTSIEEVIELSEKIQNSVDGEKTLILASVDFSHYLPVSVADFHDQKSIAVINSFDFNNIYDLEIDSQPSIYGLLKYLEINNIQKSTLAFSTNSGRLINKLDEPTTSHNIFYFTEGKKRDERLVNFLFFGDLMLDRYVKNIIDKNSVEHLLKKIAGEEDRFFQGIDIISANLEGAVTNDGTHYKPDKSNDFAFDPADVEKFGKYNFNFFNLANNHFFDQGSQGVVETRQNLDRLGFDYSGCDRRLVGECSLKMMNMGDVKIGMLGFNTTFGPLDAEGVREIVEKADAQSDLVVANVHWGVEYSHQFSNGQQEFAHDLIDSGVDIIIGHHPHVVQGMEMYKDKPIFYSLGNFIFDQYFSAETQEGLAVGLNFDVDSGEVEFYLFPFESELSRVELMSGERKEEFFEEFVGWSKR